MPPTGGLFQLVSMGGQDIYLTSHSQISFFRVNCQRNTNFTMDYVDKNKYDIDNCIREVKQHSRRKYKNFEISQISWKNEKGNISFTEKKYDELCKKYDNMIYLSIVDLSTIKFNTLKGNMDIRNKLDKQIIMAKDLRKMNKKTSLINWF